MYKVLHRATKGEIMYKVIRRDNKPIIEQFENENVFITSFLLTGEVEVEFKKGADPKVIKMYAQLMQSHK